MPKQSPSSPSHFVLFCLGLLLWQPLAAVEWSLDFNPVPRAGSRADELGLRGVWPNTCTPETISVKTDATENSKRIYLLTNTQQSACNPKPTPFLLLFDFPKNVSASSEFYWLHKGNSQSSEHLLGFKLLSQSSGQSDIRPASGWWWPEPGAAQDSGPGTGLTVDYQNGLLTLLTQTFDDHGQPEWLLGTAPMKRGIANTELIKFTQGQSLTGKYKPPLIDNSRNAIHIRFLSASRADVWLESRQGDSLDQLISLRKLTMVRYFMDPPILDRLLKGRWLVAPEDNPNYASSTQQFRVLSVSVKAPEIKLGFAKNHVKGTCRMHPDKFDSPPQRCEIEIQTEAGPITWTFKSFSMDRMRGHNQYGARVSAFKINPN
ncbi:MAG: hypothetical protein L3J24_04090 [Xanthomonadales bacterium]|nr:hypothetical protein [Xanthomonadales bacterium]